MLDLKPQILKHDGKESFVILTWDEFQAIRDALDDAEDLRILRQSREEQRDEPTISHEQLKRELGL
ncbi:MAG: hypothetical protein WC058_03150 [Phycisphaeraceae bacterium]